MLSTHQSPGFPINSERISSNGSCKTSANRFNSSELRNQSENILYNILMGKWNSENSSSSSSSCSSEANDRRRSPQYSPEEKTMDSARQSTAPVEIPRISVNNYNVSERLPTLKDVLSGYASKRSVHPELISQMRKRSEGAINPPSHYRRRNGSMSIHTTMSNRERETEGQLRFEPIKIERIQGKESDFGVMGMNVDDAQDMDSSEESSGSNEDNFGASISYNGSSTDQHFSSHDTASHNSEELIEMARSKLMRLSTENGSAKGSPPNFYPAKSAISMAAVKSLSHPGTPPSPTGHQELRRKYSMGNQDLRRPKRPMAEFLSRHRDGPDPMDLSVKRKRSEPTMVGLSSDNDGGSILRSALRGRSSTFSFGGRVPDTVIPSVPSASTGSHESLTTGGNTSSRMRVTLAKRNLNPVKSRVLERIHSMVNFVADLPEFTALPTNDQMALLSSAAHRLLLLFMAEINMEFVVAPVHLDEKEETSKVGTNGDPSESGIEGLEEMQDSSEFILPVNKKKLESPTQQFVEGIQNFIAKCHTTGIRPSEYFFMRWIVLFHAGANKLEQGDVVSNLNTAARQDLQEIITDSHPNDKLRYSKLLLTLHTVFGVNCGMLESLFCAPLQLAGGLESFACRLLRAYQQRNSAVAVAASAAANGGRPLSDEA